MKTMLKICGLTREEDVKSAIEAGAKYLGFIFYKKSPRYVEPEKVNDICRNIPPAIKKVGVFVNKSAEKIQEVAEFCHLDVVQLHGDESPELAGKLKGLEIWKAFAVNSEAELNIAEEFPADAILLDSADGRQRGGTGKECDWRLAAELSKKRRVILAGGINSENIQRAVEEVKPAIIDVNSGVEIAPGIKDKTKIYIIGKLL